ncbi:MAG: hypothetical protein R3362_07585, partial [Rhodothermales bacterium]|nr:hypothetical protein [Rhodothermales bacterium]
GALGRSALAAARPSPPLVLFPEGRIGDGDRLRPFRPGAFKVAAEAGGPILLGALRYDPLDVVHWQRGEPFGRALWRLASRPGPLLVDLDWFAVEPPLPGTDVRTTIRTAEVLIAEAAGLTPPAPKSDPTEAAAVGP